MTEKIENALNESRILVLVTQVILGFQYQSIFQSRFDRLSSFAHYAKLFSIGTMLVALLLLLAPAAYHCIVERGNVSGHFHRFINRITMPVLLPFAIGLGLEFYIVSSRIFPAAVSPFVGLAVSAFALIFWYGIEFFMISQQRTIHEKAISQAVEQMPLKDKIKFALMHARVVLPGAQALLGFQFAAVLTESFDRLSSAAKYIHFASLSVIACATIFLMAPAAYHRIVEQGENTERLYSFSTKMILGAMALLALGISGDTYIVVLKIVHSSAWALLASSITVLLFFGTWFGYTLYCKYENNFFNRSTIGIP